MKVCCRCRVELDRSHFNKCSRSKDGLRGQCKECRKPDSRAYREKFGDKIRQWQRDHHEKNRERHLEKMREYREENRESLRVKQRDYARKNRKRLNQYQAERKASDPAYALTCRARTAVRDSLRKGLKCPGFFRHMPYTKDEFVEHLKSTLPDGYSELDICDGRKLHIDHIRPIASFNLTGEVDDEFLSCWALENLQLLPAKENMQKSDTWKEKSDA